METETKGRVMRRLYLYVCYVYVSEQWPPSFFPSFFGVRGVLNSLVQIITMVNDEVESK